MLYYVSTQVNWSWVDLRCQPRDVVLNGTYINCQKRAPFSEFVNPKDPQSIESLQKAARYNTLIPSLISAKTIMSQNYGIKETVIRLSLTRERFARFSPREHPYASTEYQISCYHSPSSSCVMDQSLYLL